MKVLVDHIDIHRDSRGSIFEPIGKDALAAQQNVHIVISEPAAIRGNHYHIHGTEILAVMGEALVRIKENGHLYDVKVPAGKVYRFTIPPKVSHAIKNTGGQPNFLIAFNTIEHDPQSPDVTPDNLITS
jgi:dTDP-4-dehydrorhamnose 3,5-epimerase-like enzyme